MFTSCLIERWPDIRTESIPLSSDEAEVSFIWVSEGNVAVVAIRLERLH